jgi:2-desacetyl-2-hydroxyethyl bacteriochlorophyllide A dehydrogenase
MKRQTIFFTAPRQVELCEETLPALGADEVLVETLCSAISAGTEMLVYQGRFPRDVEADAAISGLCGRFAYPLAYGYAAVGVVTETGTQADPSWRDKLVFAFQPHTSSFIIRPSSLIPIPHSLLTESACFLPNMETAVNLVQDGAPLLGERVLVFGQGVVGLLTAALLGEFPLECLVTADRYELRRRAFQVSSPRFHVEVASLDPEANDFGSRLSGYAQDGFDLTYELSGNPSVLNDAIAATRFSGRVVIGSWYGEKRAPIDLGGVFHRSRIKLISSQVSTIAPELSARWDKSRRFSVAWEALKRIQPERWITHRVPFRQAAEAYRLLEEHPDQTIQILLTYP